MKKKTILFLVLVLLFLALLTNYSQGREEELTACYLSGNSYLKKLDENNKLFYVMGLIDMLYGFTHGDYFTILYSEIHEKTKDMTADQIKAIYDKYLKVHPEEWQNGAADIFVEAILEFVRET